MICEETNVIFIIQKISFTHEKENWITCKGFKMYIWIPIIIQISQ